MKAIIKEACLVNFKDDKGGVPVEVGETIDADKETIGSLVRMGRAKYLDKKDDPHPAKINTATPEDMQQLKSMAEAAKKAADKKAAAADK